MKLLQLTRCFIHWCRAFVPPGQILCYRCRRDTASTWPEDEVTEVRAS